MAEKKKNIVLRILTSPVLINLLIMIGIFLVLVFVTLFALNVYTKHNESVNVPSVKGFQVEEASRLLKTKDLSYEVVDSVYASDGLPGSIIDQVPREGSKVKKDRTIYLTIKAKGKEMVAVPLLTDYSRRQAEAQLHALGFDKITVSEVPSRFKGLVVNLKYQGRELEPGERIPKGSTIHMVIGGGGASWMEEEETPQPEVDESFFD